MQPDWRVVEAENPALTVHSTRFLGEGWNARAYLVNDELVFRFPKRPEHWEELDREITFLADAACKLPLPSPRYVQQLRHSAAVPYGYAVYGYLRGRAMYLDNLTPRKRVEAAIALAGFLRALHGLEPSPELAARLPREDPRMIAEEYLVRAEREIAPKLSRTAARALLQVFQTYLGEPENFLVTPTVLHADLSRDHLLIDHGAVSGIIDFGDVSWGDPDYDFMYLFVDYGSAFTEEVARRYQHTDIEQLRLKLRYFGIVDQIGTILDGAGRALEGQTEAAWRRLRELLRNT